MSKIIFRIVTIIMLAITIVYKVNAESSFQNGLELKVQCKNLQGKITDEFAVNEPVWLFIELINKNAAPISVWIDGDEYRGITCQPTHACEAKARVVLNDVHLERNFREMIISSGERIAVDAPLSDFLQVQDKCSFSLDCEMSLKNEKGKSFVIKTVVFLQFTRGLDAQEISRLVDQLQRQFDSGDESARVRVVKSSGSFPSSAVVEFLAKAISNNSERVQLAALRVLSAMMAPKKQVMPLLQKAEQSDKESVRRKAAIDIKKYQEQ
ncbi:MAG: HEAT repeat domain-containing protein [Verrucomicrobiae bacterium]|nr:HEAT repeat domain-containing protein [Verrucomicrobiae bacterium]